MNYLNIAGALCLFSLFVIGAFGTRLTGLTCNSPAQAQPGTDSDGVGD